ncbi:MAG: hypothetical protein K9J06_11435 [Flavobacteriales bacterium]|nr:hypothetical protein [Flavobacteriales bacterium]
MSHHRITPKFGPMTGDSFHALVADPSGPDRDSIALLQELNRRYPYFRAPRLLLAKSLKDTDHIDQRRQLHLAAIYAADRSLLMDLMEGRLPKEVAPEKIENGEIENGVVEAVVVQPASIEAEEALESVVSAQEENAGTETLTEVLAESAEPEASHHALDLSLIPEPVLYRVEDLLLNELAPTESETKAETAPEPDALPFDQWLARLGSSDAVPASTRPLSPVPRPSLKDNIALIEDFLAAQPKDGRSQRAEFFRPSRAAERSNTMDMTSVSETLANIYEQQGQFEIAIKAFDALALKYPDKSSYFAARKLAALEKGQGQ